MKINRKVFFFTFLFLIMSTSITSAYNPTYYKPIYINNIGGSEQTYYQVLLNVSYDSDMQPDFDDLRVKYYNGVELVSIPYWIEDKVDSEWCKLWFNATYIPANSWCNNSYRLYYGDNIANSESDGEATFEFFDDFESLDKWSILSGSWTVQTVDGKTAVFCDNVADTHVAMKADFSQMENQIIEVEVKATQFGTYREIHLYPSISNMDNRWLERTIWRVNHWEGEWGKRIGGSWSSGDINTNWMAGMSLDVWYTYKLVQHGDTATLYVDDDEVGSKTEADVYGTISNAKVGIGTAAINAYFTNFRVRKYADPEPTAQLGVEQNIYTAPTISSLTNSTPGTTSVTISWTTNQNTDNRVKYSKNSDLSNYSWSSWDNDTTSVSITLTGLYPNTVYYYQAWSHNGTYSDCYTTEPSSQPYNSFTTLNLSGIEPLYIDIEEVGEGYVKINASWIGFDAFETAHYFVFCGMSYGKVKSKKANGDGKLIVEETLYGLFVEGEEYCCKAAAYRGNSSTDSVYTDEACFIATSNKTLKQTSYGNYMDNLINISSESNVTTWASALSEPYKDRMGMTFFGIIFVLPFIAMWIRGSNTIIPSILGLILGGFIWAYMPEKFVHMAYLFIIISIAGVIYGIFRQKV